MIKHGFGQTKTESTGYKKNFIRRNTVFLKEKENHV